jgi:predicted NAD-dependent protein-ADP-ribosyltransferase YbiA (DUF1768 family)
MSTDKFVFRSNSADKAPGKGVHEYAADPKAYSTLSAIKNFRRYLSNFDSSVTFVWQGPFDTPYTFRSIEHAFQAAKIWLANPTESLKFTVESGHAIGAGDGEVARKHRKLVRLTEDDLALWDAMNWEIMASAAEAKYTQNPDSIPSQVLKATGNAELIHLATARGKPSELIRFPHLEAIRDRL